MPVVGIVVAAVGAEIGVAVLGEVVGTVVAGAIGAGIGSGLYAESQGGDFGTGFLMGAAGNFIGGQIGGMFGADAGGLTQDAMLANQLEGFSGIGDITGELGWGNNIGSTGNAGFGTSALMGDMSSTANTGMGEMALTDQQFAESLGNPQGNFMNTGVSDIGSGAYDPTTTPGTMGEWTPGGEQGNGVTTWGEAEAWNNPLAQTPTQTPPTLGTIGVSAPSTNPSLENVTAQAPELGGNPAGNFGTPPQSSGYMDKLKGLISNGDAQLAKFGMPKGSSLMGLAGIGQYMMGSYETYKAEQIAKGMKPMTLEEFQSKMYNPNDYKVAANSMAQSGRTGTLPALLARMKQQSAMDYSKNYLPTANQDWWNVNANLANMRLNNYGNLTKPLASMWSMNRAQA